MVLNGLPWKRTEIILSFFESASKYCIQGDSDSKESACSVGDLGSSPVTGRSSGEGNDNPLQYSCLKTSSDPMSSHGHGVAKSWTQLRDFTFTAFQTLLLSMRATPFLLRVSCPQ